MKNEQYYEKMIDRMDKLIIAINKLSRSIDALIAANQKDSRDADMIDDGR